MAKHQAFVAANEQLRAERAERFALEANDKSAEEELKYFPFTHGDLIERQRKTLANLYSQEML